MSFLTVAIRKETGRQVYIGKDGKIADYAKEGTEVRLDYQKPYLLKPSSLENSTSVTWLPKQASLPVSRIAAMATGAVEEYVASLGFAEPENSPKEPTVALWMNFDRDGLAMHEYVIGGPDQAIKFPLSMFMGMAGREAGAPDTQLIMTQKLSDIVFKKNKHVTSWMLFSERFKDSLSAVGANINWTEGAGVYCRYKIAAHPFNTEPGCMAYLMLEGLVIPEGPVLESFSAGKKSVINSGAATSFGLWEVDLKWNAPLQREQLVTTPGLYMTDVESSGYVTESNLRWALQHCIALTRRGAQFDNGSQLVPYLNEPKRVFGTQPPFKLVIWSQAEPVFQNVTGECGLASTSQSGIIKINGGKRAGLVIDLKAREANKRSNKSTGRNKYSTVPHPLFRLDSTALPPGCTPDMVETATSLFSCAVTRKTQCNYATAVRHLLNAETLFGRKFSSPMTEQERIYYTVFLLRRNIKKQTAANYLSAIQFYQMSKGETNPRGNSELGKRLVVGSENLNRDPHLASAGRERRPITANMLRLIGYSIARNEIWDKYEMSLRWAVCLLGFWGSFRIGELLTELRYEFNPKCCLLPSDLQFDNNCVAVWLRNPKVKSRMGDIVEVWCVEQCPELDPLAVLKAFLEMRDQEFGSNDSLPVFVHKDGSNFTKAEMNADLKSLLSTYPELAESSRDKWSGHSFRAGLSTILQKLQFSSEKIKAWGRWRSSAYMLYLKDRAARRATRAELTDTYGRILSAM